MLHRSMFNRLIVSLGAVALAVLLCTVRSATNAGAATNPGLGVADPYAVLAYSTVTSHPTDRHCRGRWRSARVRGHRRPDSDRNDTLE